MVECKSRGAYLMGLTSYGNYSVEDSANFTVYIPKINNLFAASLSVVPLQLLSYYVSLERGLDVDKPRNLAKSVTVGLYKRFKNRTFRSIGQSDMPV